MTGFLLLSNMQAAGFFHLNQLPLKQVTHLFPAIYLMRPIINSYLNSYRDRVAVCHVSSYSQLPQLQNNEHDDGETYLSVSVPSANAEFVGVGGCVWGCTFTF